MSPRLLGCLCIIGLVGCGDRPRSAPGAESTQSLNPAPADFQPSSPVQSAAPVDAACIATMPVRISLDSIGPLALAKPLTELQRICPKAPETRYGAIEGELPAMQFTFDSLQVFGIQVLDVPSEGLPADSWTVVGCGGILPRGVSSCGTWGELTDAFGNRGAWFILNELSSDVRPPVVTLEALPKFAFELAVPRSAVGSDLSQIPATTRIVRTRIERSGAR